LLYLILSENALSGGIPDTLSKCNQLTTLDLSMNQLTGQIPSSLKNCSQLNTIVLNNNLLSGEFSLDMSTMVSLQSVSVRNNSITGDLFQSLATLSSAINVTGIDFSFNELTGAFPASFDVSKLVNLKVLVLGNNKLQGSIPQWIWSLRSCNCWISGATISRGS
jgi:Leucine-rich repeat (LRR) protein